MAVADSKGKRSSENRGSVRTQMRAEIKLSHPDVGDLTLHTGNISNDGAYILAEGNITPCIGELVSVQVQGIGGGEAPEVTMRIVRIDKNGIGLEFVNDDKKDGKIE